MLHVKNGVVYIALSKQLNHWNFFIVSTLSSFKRMICIIMVCDDVTVATGPHLGCTESGRYHIFLVWSQVNKCNLENILMLGRT